METFDTMEQCQAAKEALSIEYLPDRHVERNFYPDVQMVANDLYSKGLVAAGKYEIDW
jgi:hypothetical protein